MPARPNRRDVLKGLVGAGASLWLPGGCGRRSAQGITPHERVASAARAIAGRTSTLRVLYPKGALGNVEPVARAFRELVGIEVALIEASLDEISAEVVLSHTMHPTTSFDVAVPASFGIPDLVEAGAILPLDAFAEKHVQTAEFPASLYTLGDRYKGDLYGYQTDGDVYVMFYLSDWMEDATAKAAYADLHGRALAIPRTWEELDRQIRFFHQPDAGRHGGVLYRNLNYIGWEYWSRLHAKGLYPVDSELQPRFDTDAAEEALVEMVRAGASLSPDAAVNGLFENFASYARGDKYCDIGWGGTQKHLRSPDSDVRDRVVHGPVPGGTFDGVEVPMPHFNWGWNYVVSSRAPEPELAYLFVRFASTPHVSTLSVRHPTGFFDPFRDEHYADGPIREIYGSSFMDVHQTSMRTAIPDFYLRGQGRYFQSLKQAVHAACAGEVAPRRALSELSDRWNAITDELGRDAQKVQWALLQDSYHADHKAVLS